LDGSVWVTRQITTEKKTKYDVAQYIASAAKWVSFGGSGTSINAFDFMYSVTVDTSSDSDNQYDVQTCDIMGLNAMIMSYLTDIIASYLP